MADYTPGARVQHEMCGAGVIDYVIHRAIYAPGLLSLCPTPIGVEVESVVVTHDEVGAWRHADGTLEVLTP